MALDKITPPGEPSLQPQPASTMAPLLNRMQGSLLVGVTALVCLGMALAGWLITNRLTENLARERFEAKASECAYALNDHLTTYEIALRAGVAFASASKDINRAQWRDYCANLDIRQNYSGIQGLGYAPVITNEEKAQFVQSVRAEGFPRFDILPLGDRPLYTPIRFLEPFDERNQRAFGYDMYSEATRREAMDLARDTGHPTISGKVILVQETKSDVQAGFLMYFPVYREGGHLDTIAERKTALKAYVYSAFRMNNFMKDVLEHGFHGVGIEIFDGEGLTTQALMFQNSPEHSPSTSSRVALFDKTVSKEYFGRVWTLRLYSLPEFEADIDRTLPLLTLAGGLGIGFLLVLILLSLSDTQRKATAIADRMTTDLRESEERMRLILSSTGEPIYGIDLKGECTFCNTACVRALGYSSPEQLLGKNMHTLIHHTKADGSHYEVKDCPIFKAFLLGQEVHVVDEPLWRADGTSFPSEFWSFPQKSNGKVLGAVVVFQDITERKLAEQESAKLAGLVQAASRVAIIACDTRGIITVFNKGAENLLGYTAQEMVGTPVERIHLQSEVEQQGAVMSQRMGRPIDGFEVFVANVREGDYEAKQWTYLRKDGAHVPVELVVTGLRDKSLNLMGFVGVATDMTDRVNAERALRRSKDRFHKLAELSPVGIFETDTEGNCLFVNQRWQQMAGLTLKQASGQGWISAIHPDDLTAVFEEWQSAVANHREFSLEYRFMTPEGKITWLTGSARAVLDDTGTVRGYFGTVLDIDNRVKAEAAMRESEARLSAVLETAVDPILTVDLVGTILSANKAARETFGYEMHELEGNNVKMLMPEPFHSNHDSYLERYRTTKDPHIIGRGGREVLGRLKDGSIIPVELSVSEFTSHGETFYTGILRNISERVKARDEILAANEMLSERQRSLDADLEAASEIQRGLLPKQGTCSVGLTYDFRFMPSASIGGDIFNVVCLGGEHTALYMVDVSGHGVPAALVSVSLAQELTANGDLLMDKFLGQPRQPEAVLRILDSNFPMERFDKFFSMFYMLYEQTSGVLQYCNAGHPPPVLLRADGSTELLEEGGTLVGIGHGHMFKTGKLLIEDGDVLLAYTDGVTELLNPEEEQFGADHLLEIFKYNVGRSPEQVLNIISGKLQAHADGRPPDDDISIICVRLSRT